MLNKSLANFGAILDPSLAPKPTLKLDSKWDPFLALPVTSLWRWPQHGPRAVSRQQFSLCDDSKELLRNFLFVAVHQLGPKGSQGIPRDPRESQGLPESQF